MANENNFARNLALGLGWFSIGLGLAQLLAPRKVSAACGMKKNNTLMRALGVREITSGVGILSQKKTSKWMWSRVAGDAMDLAILGSALSSKRANKGRAIVATAAVAGIAALDVYSSQKLSGMNGADTKKLKVRKSITIERSPEELYEFWRHFERLPAIMGHLESVEQTGSNRWRWTAHAPAGRTVSWEAEIIDEVPNKLISWHSLPGATVENAGTVRFDRATGNRGTVVTVELDYSPPAGVIGAAVAKMFHEAPDQQIAVDLRRFKQLMETGEITRTEGQPAGRPNSLSKKYDEMVRV